MWQEIVNLSSKKTWWNSSAFGFNFVEDSNYTDFTEKLANLRTKTIEVVESSREGATNSIQKAGTTSDSASAIFEEANR